MGRPRNPDCQRDAPDEWLFRAAPKVATAHDDDAAARQSVKGRVQHAVLDFFALRARNAAPTFNMSDLTEYVRSRVPTAPDSAGRIMRALAADGRLAYQLVSRSQSLYRVTTDSTSEGTC